MAKRIAFTQNFRKNYARMPAEVRNRFDKQLQLFEKDPRHHSLEIHRYKTVKNVWEGYVTKYYRFTFSSMKGEYIFRNIGPHGIIDRGFPGLKHRRCALKKMATCLVLFFSLFLSIAGVEAQEEPGVEAPIAVAEIRGVGADSPITGMAAFTESGDGLEISVFIAGAPPGRHGFHIHEIGSCEDGGKAAGGHFNPAGAAHGDAESAGIHAVHAGDLGNINIGPDGTGTLQRVIPDLSFDKGPYGVAGRALILHEKEDDFGQPTGNAGSRIACGLIPDL